MPNLYIPLTSTSLISFFFFNATATTEIYTLSLHDALPIWPTGPPSPPYRRRSGPRPRTPRSEEHTSELQSPYDLVCRLLLEKKKQSKKQEPAKLHTSSSRSRASR